MVDSPFLKDVSEGASATEAGKAFQSGTVRGGGGEAEFMCIRRSRKLPELLGVSRSSFGSSRSHAVGSLYVD